MNFQKQNKRLGLVHKLILVCVIAYNGLFAQKVGIVLSGGGASGLAHIGVLKALEENNIPISYITGTSIGSIIGGLYAAGMSPNEIHQFFKNERYLKAAKGEYEFKYNFDIKKPEIDASFIRLKVSFDSSLIYNIPTNIVSSIPIDFVLMETFGPVSARCKYNFDSLFVPYRCVASDITNKRPVIFSSGDMGIAIRSSMAYPFYLRPINMDGNILFDGGLYNNFPADVMLNDFYPDLIIGSTVTNNGEKPNEDNLYLQVRNMLMSPSDFTPNCENAIVIKPWGDVGLTSFEDVDRLVDSGYVAGLIMIQEIKNHVTTPELYEDLLLKRLTFKNKITPLVFDTVTFNGFRKGQKEFALKILGKKKNKDANLSDLMYGYYRLAQEEKIKSIFPKAIFNPETKKYNLNLKIKPEKNFTVLAGGNFSNKPISNGFLGLEYNYLGRIALKIYTNAYFGKLSSSLLGKIKLEFPTKIPFFVEPTICYSRWDYFSTSTLFFNLQKPPYLKQRDNYALLNAGIPLGAKSKITANVGLAELDNLYFQTDNFTEKDTNDRTNFSYYFAGSTYEYSTLNRKLYPSNGAIFNLSTKFINGTTVQLPGSTSNPSDTGKSNASWFNVKLLMGKYFTLNKHFKLGLSSELVYSNQALLRNYYSSILLAPAFTPTPESSVTFYSYFRTFQYGSIGGKLIYHPIKNLDIRLETYAFQPVRAIIENADHTASYANPFTKQYYSAMAAAVYHTPVGPFSVSMNYYNRDKINDHFSFMLHFGYTINNKKSIDFQ